MGETNAVDVYRDTLSGYPSATGGVGRSVYEGVPVLDFQLRFITLLCVATSRVTGISATRLPKTLGFGTLHSLIRQIQRDIALARTTLPRLQRLVEGVTKVLDRNVTTDFYGPQSLKRLRDLASHGGVMPTDLTLDSIIEELSSQIEDFLAGSRFVYEPSKFTLELVDDKEKDPLSMAPLFFLDGRGHLGVYWRYSQGRATYSLHGPLASEFVQRDENVLASLVPILSSSQTNDPLKVYQIDVGVDLASFSEAGATPVYYDDGSTFTYFWKYASSTGAIDRHDAFRLGVDQVREWLSGDEWVGYSHFLRSIANWQVVAHRLHHKYKVDEQDIIDAEIDAIGWSFSEVAHPGAVSVKLTDLSGRTIKNLEFAELMKRVDDDLGSVVGQTEIVFVTGDAGIGKTQALFNAAKERARCVAEAVEGTSDLARPLYLYVRASGNVLADLTDSIGSAINATRGLTEEAVAALCRNGLIALLIDGFDELLGGTAYSDAVGSLRTWLEKLGGRGVTVVSARSSYYLNQYRSSIRRAELAGNLAIFHRVAQLQPWTETKMSQHLKTLGIESAGLQRLRTGERRLLRLPFFLRVYAQMLVERERTEPRSLTVTPNGLVIDFLLDNYLARESMKLQPDAMDRPLVSTTELERFFEFCAEMMSTRAESSLDVEDLELAAEMVIAASLDTRPGLKTRLPALCGLSVGSAGDVRFSFSHEVFYDHFLGGAAGRYFGGDGAYGSYLVVLLSRSIWGSAAVERLVAESGVPAILRLLSQLDPVERADTQSEARMLAANAGAIFAALMRSGVTELSEINLVGFHINDEINLTSIAVKQISFIGCRFTALTLPPLGNWSVSLEDSSVSELRVQRGARLSGLSHCSSKCIEHLVTDNDYVEDTAGIAGLLKSLGAQIVDGAAFEEDLVPAMVIAKQRFLRKLADASISTMVLLDRDKLPSDDQRADWITEIGADEWRRFVADLTSCELAKLESLSTSGSSKVRLRLVASPESILDKTSARGDLSRFWSN